jgi:Phytanoyl-CoA dioxygenase (PhyH)
MPQTIPVVRPAPDPDLGRLLDRAAGALSHSHPVLAGELMARAGREHEARDPFDAFTGDAQVDWFRGFGYLILRGFFEPALVDQLRDELVRTMLDVHGDRYHERPPMSGMAGHYTCLLGPWAPRTVELVDSRRLVGLAERLVGGGVLPSPCDTQGILYFDHAGWHNDTGIAIRGVKFVAYLEPLDADSGALRVLPGSHRLAEAALGHLYSLDLAVPDVAGQVLATEPGDVICMPGASGF